jgi:hypothetical protein
LWTISTRITWMNTQYIWAYKTRMMLYCVWSFPPTILVSRAADQSGCSSKQHISGDDRNDSSNSSNNNTSCRNSKQYELVAATPIAATTIAATAIAATSIAATAISATPITATPITATSIAVVLMQQQRNKYNNQSIPEPCAVYRARRVRPRAMWQAAGALTPESADPAPPNSSHNNRVEAACQ